MFPINENDAYRKGDGSLTTMREAIVSGGGGELPIASASTLGGVKIGDGVSVDEDGTISVSGEIKYYDGTLNSKSYTGKTWTEGLLDVSNIPDYANKHYISVLAREESGFTAVLENTALSLDNYLSVNVYAINAASSKALKVRVFYY